MSHRLSIMVIAVLTVLSGCGGGRSDPFGTDNPAGGLDLPGIAERPNIAVDATNLVKVFDQITLEAYTAQMDAAAALTKTQDLRLSGLRTLGDYSGYTVVSGSVDLIPDSLVNNYNMTVTFKSYSIAGKTLLDGELTISSRLWQVDGGFSYGHPVFDGELSFKGDWQGQIIYLGLRLPVTPTGELVSAESVFSDDDSVPSSFYPRGTAYLKSDKGTFEFTPFF